MTSAIDETEVIEWAPFQVAAGVTEERLLHASTELQDAFLSKQPGFLRRELLRGRNDGWVDVVHWVDQRAADAAMQAAADSPACHAYFALMVAADHAAPGEGVLHFRRIAAYP